MGTDNKLTRGENSSMISDEEQASRKKARLIRMKKLLEVEDEEKSKGNVAELLRGDIEGFNLNDQIEIGDDKNHPSSSIKKKESVLVERESQEGTLGPSISSEKNVWYR